MALPRFSEMLVNQRQSLDIPLSTAAQVLRIKEVTLDVFERGDFDQMPQSGYAQGMLSSYARYLGLNPNIVTSLYAEDLYEYEHGSSSRELRQRSRRLRTSESDELPSYERADNSPAGRARTRRISEGMAGGLSTSAPVARRGRGLVSGPPGRYSTQHADANQSHAPSRSQSSVFGSRNSGQSTPLVTGRPYTSAASQARVRGSYGRAAARPSSAGSPVGAAANMRRAPHESGDIIMQRVAPSQYQDDLVYDGVVDSYAPASTQSGAMASRNIASRQRPNVSRGSSRSRRRPSSGGSARNSRGRSRQQSSGLIGDVLSNRRNVVLLGAGIVLLVVIFLVVGAVRSCTAPKTSEKPEQVGVTTVKREDGAASPQTPATASAASSASASTASTPSSPASPHTPASPMSALANAASADGSAKVVVEVLDGEVAWVEIVCDGKSDARTVTGPKTFEYTVHESFSISVNNTGAVKVTRNGQQLPFDSKVQGRGSLAFQLESASSSSGSDSTSRSTTIGSSSGSGDSSDSSDDESYDEYGYDEYSEEYDYEWY